MSVDLKSIQARAQSLLKEPQPAKQAATVDKVAEALAKSKALQEKYAFQPAASPQQPQGAPMPPQGGGAPMMPPQGGDPSQGGQAPPPVDPNMAAQMQAMAGGQAPQPAPQMAPPEQAPPAIDPKAFAEMLDTMGSMTTALEQTRAENQQLVQKFESMQQEFLTDRAKMEMIMEAIMERPEPAGDVYGASGVQPQAPQPDPTQNPAGAMGL